MRKYLQRGEQVHCFNLARKARRRGDHAEATRWLRHAEQHMRVAALCEAWSEDAMVIALNREIAREKASAELDALQNPPSAFQRSGPVMLDPKGFSPGGTPNWVLNNRRRERAGLGPGNYDLGSY